MLAEISSALPDAIGALGRLSETTFCIAENSSRFSPPLLSASNRDIILSCIIAGLGMLSPNSTIDVYTDSQLVVNILTKWAEGWKAKGWKKKSSGPIANLELVQEAYALTKQRPRVGIRWIKAHSGNRWNEYADSLATAYRRDEF